MEKNKNVPKLRFPEFTGEWEEKKLGEIFNISAGGDIDSKHVSQEKTKIFNYPIYANSEKEKGLYGYSDIYKIEENVVTVTGRGVNIGIAHARNHKFYPIVRLLVLKPIQDDNIYFYEYQINRLNLYKESTGVPQLTAPQVSGYMVNYPPITEQTQIASFLTAVDEKLTQLKKKKTLLEQYKKGIMQKLFSQELRFKDNNNQDFPDWQEKTLGEISDVRDGTHESPQYYDYGFPFITSKNLLKDGNIDFDNVSYINEHDFNRFNFRSKVDVNDILFAMIGTIGNPVLVSKDGFAIKNVALIKEKGNLLNIFLIHYMKGPSINQQFFEQNTGGTQKFLSLSVIKNLIVAVPSLPEQQKIATFLSSIDEKISHSSAQIEKMEAWKKGLLQQMFC